MSRLKSKLPMLMLAVVFMGCDSSSDGNGATGGGEVYVAVGNSLTAGYQSGGLRSDWQMNSYPVLLAKQMGIEDFQIPVIDSPGIGREKIAGQTTIPLFLDSNNNPTTKLLGRPASELLSNSKLDRPYNNLGVPGLTTKDFISAYDSSSGQVPGNGFLNIVLRGGLFQNSTMLRQAISLKPTIMTMWIGNNDLLGGITAGTVIEGVTVTPASYYSAMMDKAFDTLLAETSAHIFIANIPSIPTIPFVTTVPTYIFNPATFQPAVDTSTKFLTVESDVKYVLLPALAQIAKGNGIPTALGGTGVALAANLTLTQAEADKAVELTDAYNAYLKAKAEANPARLTLMDVNSLLVKLNAGEISGLSAKYYKLDSAHTAFSLDGVHPNTKGYKEIANFFLEIINSTLGKHFASVP